MGHEKWLISISELAWGHLRDGNGSSFVTHDPCDPSRSWPMTHMTHDPRPVAIIHHFILRMRLGGAWHGGTGQPSRSWEQKKCRLKLSPQLWKLGLTEWMSSFLMSTKNKKLQATGMLLHHHGSMGHWHWPVTHVITWPIQKWWPIWPMTHDPLTHFHLWDTCPPLPRRLWVGLKIFRNSGSFGLGNGLQWPRTLFLLLLLLLLLSDFRFPKALSFLNQS